jgi:hypothetical protein
MIAEFSRERSKKAKEMVRTLSYFDDKIVEEVI